MITTTTRERPILFSGPMVRAILDGRKTQTRRLVTPQPTGDRVVHAGGALPEWVAVNNGRSASRGIPCPYGAPGDRLWVREAHVLVADPLGVTPGIVYDADGEVRWRVSMRDGSTLHNYAEPDKWRRRAARFLRTEHARITLEITDVRVERLQEITEDDARAEGVELGLIGTGLSYHAGHRAHSDERHFASGDLIRGYRGAFAAAWDQINGKRATWESNPWVWVLTFRRIEL